MGDVLNGKERANDMECALEEGKMPGWKGSFVNICW